MAGDGSRLVFGCMGLGGGWDDAPPDAGDLATAHAAVDAALEAGITLFDHADIYTRGKAEEVFGRVLAERPGLRDDIELQSKCGIVLAGPDGSGGRYDSSPAVLTARVEDILRRLGIERLDALLIHRPDPLTPMEDVAAAFAGLRDAGKVGRLGVSNMSAAQMRALQDALGEAPAVNQLEMGLHRRDWLESQVLVNHPEGGALSFPEGTIEYCRAEGVELQAWGALAQGRYSGRSTTPEPGPGAAPRPGSGAASPEEEASGVVRELADGLGCAPEAVVLGWLMRHPARIRPVIGTTNPARIAACAGAERAAAAMGAVDWYRLWTAARGRPLP
ncbi:aldo/keto reductase [Zafaria sp. Z1313]|uniref:aldo/keto reductase n=1 Tax=Zafaria sp. Z1313 TaxID=3423202 RepID=UPI003D3024E5